jgi:hypothetical protein
MRPSGDALTRIASLSAALRRCLAAVRASESSWVVNAIDGDLVRLAADVDALADEIMIAALQPRTHCHCGAPIETHNRNGRRRDADVETCGSDHCRATAREEARKTIRRYGTQMESHA